MGGRGAAGKGRGSGGASFTFKGLEIRGASKMPRTQAEWTAYDKKVDAGQAASLRSLEGTFMSEQYLKQSVKKVPGGYQITRDSKKVYKTKKAALDWIGDSTQELKDFRAGQRGG